MSLATMVIIGMTTPAFALAYYGVRAQNAVPSDGRGSWTTSGIANVVGLVTIAVCCDAASGIAPKGTIERPRSATWVPPRFTNRGVRS